MFLRKHTSPHWLFIWLQKCRLYWRRNGPTRPYLRALWKAIPMETILGLARPLEGPLLYHRIPLLACSIRSQQPRAISGPSRLKWLKICKTPWTLRCPLNPPKFWPHTIPFVFPDRKSIVHRRRVRRLPRGSFHCLRRFQCHIPQDPRPHEHHTVFLS